MQANKVEAKARASTAPNHRKFTKERSFLVFRSLNLSFLTATCNPTCKNGGTCAGQNTCHCDEGFVGAECQYSTDRCSPHHTGFNGGFKCSGTQIGLTCTISCPPEIDFEFPPAKDYTCDFATGTFKPAKIPKCVFGRINFLKVF